MMRHTNLDGTLTLEGIAAVTRRREQEGPPSKRRLKRLHAAALREEARINRWLLEEADDQLLRYAHG